MENDLNLLTEIFVESFNNPNPIKNQDKYFIYSMMLREFENFEEKLRALDLEGDPDNGYLG